MNKPKECRYCGSLKLIPGPGRGPHYKAWICARCHRHNGWIPDPRFIADPGTFPMPFGKFKGRTLDQITCDGNIQYLEWMSKNIKPGNVQRHIEAFLRPKFAVVSPEVDECYVDENQHEEERLEAADLFWDKEILGPDPPY